MTLDKSGKLWRGEDFTALAGYIRHFQAEGYPVDQVVEFAGMTEEGGHSATARLLDSPTPPTASSGRT